ncbi:MAG TPA: efflux RND transporter periplasmic adaptor subunit, partial [Anseongella sp.]|nr:efflux RND transporter periplasmic adaptor subunit [Anseongella sp.]
MNRMKIMAYGLVLALMTACVSGNRGGGADPALSYTCPMHPQVVQEGLGICPICFMDLVPVARSGSEQEIMLSRRQMELGNIRVGVAGYGETKSGIYLAGVLKANEELREIVSSRTGGRIERLHVKESGQHISKGRKLYELYSEDLLTLQKEYLLALQQDRELGHKNSRYASLAEAAEKKLLLYGMTQEQVDDLVQTGQLSPSVTFLAPAGGVVTEVLAAEGQYISEGAPLYSLEGLGRLWVDAAVYP